MTISRPLSLPVIHPPSVTVATMPCQERWQYPATDACSDTPPRPRNASLDVPLLQRTLATLQEQIGLITPPDSDHGGGGTGSKTVPSAKSPQTINVLESRNTELVDEMFGLLVSRIGQRVELSAFVDAIESLLMQKVHTHGTRMMLLSSPPVGKYGVHSWTLVTPGVKVDERKWRRRQSGAFDLRSDQRRSRVTTRSYHESSSHSALQAVPPAENNLSEREPSDAACTKRSQSANSKARSRHSSTPQRSHRSPLKSIEEQDAEILDFPGDFEEWQRLMAQRQQGITQWRAGAQGLEQGVASNPSTYLKSSSPPRTSGNIASQAAGANSSLVSPPVRLPSTIQPDSPLSEKTSRQPTGYAGSPGAPSESSLGSLAGSSTGKSYGKRRAASVAPISSIANSAALATQRGALAGVDYGDTSRRFLTRVPELAKGHLEREPTLDSGLPSSLYYTAPTRQPDSGQPSTMYYTAPTHPQTEGGPQSARQSIMFQTAAPRLSGQHPQQGHMLFPHEHFDVRLRLSEERKDGAIASFVSKLTSRS